MGDHKELGFNAQSQPMEHGSQRHVRMNLVCDQDSHMPEVLISVKSQWGAIEGVQDSGEHNGNESWETIIVRCSFTHQFRKLGSKSCCIHIIIACKIILVEKVDTSRKIEGGSKGV